jgi:hypothetical protein
VSLDHILRLCDRKLWERIDLARLGLYSIFPEHPTPSVEKVLEVALRWGLAELEGMIRIAGEAER